MKEEEREDAAQSPERYDGGSYSVHAIHMVRSSMLAHLQLSQMADQKASLLMGATFVVFSIAVGQAASLLMGATFVVFSIAVGQAAAGSYRLSLLILALSAFISASLAVAAVVPKIHAKPPSGGRQNLLFFGVFAHMSEADYIDAIMKVSETDGRVLSTMARDIYQNGMVLQTKKYKLLGYAYRTFQIGLTLTFLVFLFESQDTLQAIFG